MRAADPGHRALAIGQREAQIQTWNCLNELGPAKLFELLK